MNSSINVKSTGQNAYEVYADHADWKSFDGRDLPQWDGLSEAVQGHWETVADAVTPPVLDISDRERQQIYHALAYAETFSEAGIPGHGQIVLIAKLAKSLGFGIAEIP